MHQLSEQPSAVIVGSIPERIDQSMEMITSKGFERGASGWFAGCTKGCAIEDVGSNWLLRSILLIIVG